ncbi:MAG: hypothetical protein AAB116_17640 [Candidatus Poribacteria bacterium]
MNDAKIISHINSHRWWRTTLPDEKIIKARGLFYASSYKEAEFYGRPIDTPFKVNVKKPLFGDEAYIMRALSLQLPTQDIGIKERFALDAKMMRLATAKDYDSIALVTTKAYEMYLNTGVIPRSIELQIFN